MRDRSRWSLAVAILAGCWVGLAGGAEGRDWWLTPQTGKYVIYITSFRGDQAEEQARQLVAELRAEPFKLNAYLFRRVDEEAREEKERLLRRQKEILGTEAATNLKKVRVLEEFAVFVGGYRDQPQARADLERIKKLQRPTSLGNFGLVQWTKPKTDGAKTRSRGGDGSEKEVEAITNVFARAFVTHNPMLIRASSANNIAQEIQRREQEDKLLQEANALERFSLINCPQPYTLIVKEFIVPTKTEAAKPSVFQKMKSGFAKPFGKLLDEDDVAVQADKLAELLRDNGKGYDAYVLHSRTSSIVTVGGFSGPNDPALAAVRKQLAGAKVGSFQLLAAPVYFEVPRPGKTAQGLEKNPATTAAK
jgi:hypothetical protein